MRLLVFCLLASCSIAAFPQVEPSSIGRIVAAKTASTIVEPDGTQRAAMRREEVWAGESLLTSGEGFMQVRFADNSLLLLACDSQVKIHEFRRDSSGEGAAWLELLRGEVRLIPGDLTQYSYLLTSLSAEVSLDASGIDVGMISDGEAEVLVAAFSGDLSLQSGAGTEALGEGQAWDFASVTGNAAPVGRGELPQGAFSDKCGALTF